MAWRRYHFRLIGRSLAAAGRMMLRHEVPRDAAGISYFGLMALFPAMLVVIAMVDALLGRMDLHETVVQSIVDLFPGSRQFLRSSLNEIMNPSTAVVLSCAFVVLWSSSYIFAFIEGAINRAWNVSHQRTFLESRLLSMALMALGGFGLLCSAAITAFVSFARAQAAAHVASSARADYFMGWFWYFVLLGAGLLIAVLVFAFVFKWTPHCRVFWREAFSGALVSTVLWEVGSLVFVWIVPLFNYQRVYGRMGATIALLAWVYTSNLILIFGANFSAQMEWATLEPPLPGSGLNPGEKPRRFPLGR